MECPNCGAPSKRFTDSCTNCGISFHKSKNEREYCPDCHKPLLFPDKPCPYCNNNLRSSSGKICSNCSAPLKKGLLFSNNRKLSYLDALVLNRDASSELCESCYEQFKQESTYKLDLLQKKFNAIIDEMPVLSIEKPVNMTLTRYCRIVTAQSIVETGDIGMFIKTQNKETTPSLSFDRVLTSGENSCLRDLKKKLYRPVQMLLWIVI